MLVSSLTFHSRAGPRASKSKHLSKKEQMGEESKSCIDLQTTPAEEKTA